MLFRSLTASGAYTIATRIVDAAGNLGAISGTRIFSLDTVAPVQTVAITNLVDDVALTTGTISDGGVSNDPSPTLSGTLSAVLGSGEVLQLYVNGVYSGTATVTATNQGTLRTPWLRLWEPVGRDAGAPMRMAPLRSGASGDATYRIPTDHRGIVELGPLRVERTDHFGLAASGSFVGPSHPQFQLML